MVYVLYTKDDEPKLLSLMFLTYCDKIRVNVNFDFWMEGIKMKIKYIIIILSYFANSLYD